MLCLAFDVWRCIDAGKEMILDLFLRKTSAPARFAAFVLVPKQETAGEKLTTNMGWLRSVSRSRVCSARHNLRTDSSQDLSTIFAVSCRWLVSDLLENSSRVPGSALPRLITTRSERQDASAQ